MCNLVSVMCLNRNYKGINALVDMYPLDFTLDSFMNEKLPHKLRVNLAKMLERIHIDKDPLEEITFPKYTRPWKDLDKVHTKITNSA